MERKACLDSNFNVQIEYLKFIKVRIIIMIIIVIMMIIMESCKALMSWHIASQLTLALLPWLYSTAAIKSLEHYFQDTNSCQLPIFLTYAVECWKCGSMSCQRTLVLQQIFKSCILWFKVRRFIHWTYTIINQHVPIVYLIPSLTIVTVNN